MSDDKSTPQFSHYRPSYLTSSLVAVGTVVFVGLHGAMLFSIPSVLRSRGAPYLPTFQRDLDSIFRIIRSHHSIVRTNYPFISHFTFIDLGSGDGRLVFRAARENMFQRCFGYEINPVLHAWVSVRRLLQPKYHASTKFILHDLWTIDLSTHDGFVVATVYGLYPIMKPLGEKLKRELKPGSMVISLFFEIPGWESSALSSVMGHNHSFQSKIYVYVTPCWS